MRVAITVQTATGRGQRLTLRAVQVASFGRTDWADFAFPDDAGLGDVHFSIRCEREGCFLQAHDPRRPTLVNGVAVADARLQPGDVLQAGQTRFWVHFEPPITESPQLPLAVAATGAGESQPPEPVGPQAEWAGLSAAGLELAQQPIAGDEFGSALVAAGLTRDAIRWYAHRLPKPLAVLWVDGCLRQQQLQLANDRQQSAYQAAIAWAKEPTEEHRQAAALQAEQTDCSGIGGALAAAAGWSGGSLLPDDQPLVAPDERLTARCIVAALSLAECQPSPATAAQRRLAYLELVPRLPTSS